MRHPGYFLVSKRLGFRLWKREDLSLAKGLWGDPEVTCFFCKEPLSDKQVEERLQAEIDRAIISGVQYWPVFELLTGEHVGCCGLRPYGFSQRGYELGFHLRRSCWGKGYATEAAESVLNYGIEKLEQKDIYAGHHPDNAPSRHVLLKLGFEEIGTEFYEPTGLFHPNYLFKLSRPVS